MNWKWFIGLSMLWLLPMAVPAEDMGPGRISFIQGQAQIQPAGSKEWQVASVNVPVRTGDRFWTPEDARLELQFQNGTVLRLDYKSTLDVLSLDESAMQFHLSMGHLLFRTSRKPAKTIQVDLPDSSLVVQDKALFRVDIAPDGGEEFGLFQGTMQIASAGTKTNIRTGEMLSMENGSSEVSPLKPADEWEQWNTDRDRQQKSAAASAQYLPPELNAYADDLNANGDWVNVPDYGYCWEPRAGIDVGWAPFRFGSWLWMDDDWCWVGAESWGWAPYHYGSWFWNSNRWCWAPPMRGNIHWGPARVGWIHSAGYVGWVPLAPGEEFHRGAAFNGQFHNLPHAGAATVVGNSVFGKGRVVPVTAHGNFLTAGNYQVGQPNLHPAGNMHVGPVVAANRLPSAQIRSQNVAQLRQQHPLLKVVPAQSHQYRPGYSTLGNRVQGSKAASGSAVWGNRSVQHMWWASPKSSGASGKAGVRGSGNVHSEGGNSGNFQGNGGGGNFHGGGEGGGNVHEGGGGGGGGGNFHGGGRR
jgi:hypothetical protein